MQRVYESYRMRCLQSPLSCHKEKNTDPQDRTELHISQHCAFVGKVQNRVTVSDEISFVCTVIHTGVLKNQ